MTTYPYPTTLEVCYELIAQLRIHIASQAETIRARDAELADALGKLKEYRLLSKRIAALERQRSEDDAALAKSVGG